jgi:hypothetical protein
MATHFNHDCPHCLTRGAGFEVTYQWRPGGIQDANLLAICGICKGGMTVQSYFRTGGNAHPDLVRDHVNYPGDRYRIVETWPKFVAHCPADVPANVESFYNQGLENLAAGRWDAAGAMFRKSLDVATKIIAPDKRSKNLYTRINELVSEGVLTTAMGEWSHEIRLDGNDAVHDEEPETEADATISQRFTEALLTYSFTLPAMVEENRSKRTPAANDVTAATGI